MNQHKVETNSKDFYQQSKYIFSHHLDGSICQQLQLSETSHNTIEDAGLAIGGELEGTLEVKMFWKLAPTGVADCCRSNK